MAILLKRSYPLHLKHRYRHIARQLVRDRRFLGSVIGLAALGILIGVTIAQAPQIEKTAGEVKQAVAISLATSGDYSGWHSYTDAGDRFQADFPCFVYTFPNLAQSTTPLGTLTVRNTACLYNATYQTARSGNQTLLSQDNFWVKTAPAHYPTDAAGQSALLQEIATSFDPNTPITITSIHGLPAVLQQRQSSASNANTYYTFGNGNLYFLITNYRPGSPDYTARFINSFQLTK